MTGPGNSPAVTDQVVTVGTYQLSESGPIGYRASNWSCVGADAADAGAGTVSLVEGNVATCTITNTALARATIQKDFVSAVQNPDTGIWTVTYDLSVTNPNTLDAVTYDLSDTIGFPAGVTVNSVTVTGPTGALVNPAFDGSADPVITTGRLLAGGASESYQLVVTADVPVTVASGSRACQTGPGFGFYNDGTVTTAGLSDSDSACGDIPEPPVPTITKTVTTTTQQPDGSWTIVYDLAVTNPNPTFRTVYSLSDVLHFGGGITVNAASVAGLGGLSTNPAWDGFSVSDVLPSPTPRPIGPSSTHHYTVTANATVTAASVTTDRDCTLANEETGSGFLNVATVTFLQQTFESQACDGPVSPTVTKTVVSVDPTATANVFIVNYDVSVANPSAITGLIYHLTDTPQFPTQIAISNPIASMIRSNVDGTNAGSATPIGGWTPGSSLASDMTLPANTRDVYRISLTVTVPADLPAAQQECSGSTPGNGLFNAATARSGNDVFEVTACAAVHPQAPTPPTTVPTPPTTVPTPPSPTPPTGPTPPPGRLPVTGTDVISIGRLAGLLLLAGGGLLLRTRRRRLGGQS